MRSDPPAHAGLICGDQEGMNHDRHDSDGIRNTATRGITPEVPLTAPRVGVGAIVIKDGTVLLIKRGNPPNQGTWAIPGGMVELGETLQEAAEREIREETGLTIRAKTPVYVFDFIDKDPAGRLRFHYVIVDLVAEFVDGELRAADDAADARWFSAAELDELDLSANTRKLLKEIHFIM